MADEWNHPSRQVGALFAAGGTRRQFIRGAGGVALSITAGGLLGACGDSGSADTENLLEGKASGTIRIATYEDPTVELIPSKFLPMFEEETGIKAEWSAQDYGTFFEKAVNDAQSGTGAFDVFLLDDPWMPQFASANLILNLTKGGFTADSDFPEAAIGTAYWPPKSGPVPPNDSGKRGGDRQRRKRRCDGRPWRSWDRAPDRTGSRCSEAALGARRLLFRARHHRDADAGVDGLLASPYPSRGL